MPFEVPNLPVIEIRTVSGEGHYVHVDGKPWARFEGYEHAAQCCATLVSAAIAKL